MFCTEDSRLSQLNDIVEQREMLRSKVATFPFDGVSKLGSGAALVKLRGALGDHHKMVVHRDRDCMTDDELKGWVSEYSKPGLIPWVTAGSDIEMYFCSAENVASALGIKVTDAQAIIDDVLEHNEEEFSKTFRNKRSEINKKLYEKTGGSPSIDDLWVSLPVAQKVKGKDLLSSLRGHLQFKGYDEKSIGRTSSGHVVASDLLALLQSLI